MATTTSDHRNRWAPALGVLPGQASQFTRIALGIGAAPPAILRMMIDRVVKLDRDLVSYGFQGLAAHSEVADLSNWVVAHSVNALPLDVRSSHFIWPPERPFPWSAEQCEAAVIGYEVKWSEHDRPDFGGPVSELTTAPLPEPEREPAQTLAAVQGSGGAE